MDGAVPPFPVYHKKISEKKNTLIYVLHQPNKFFCFASLTRRPAELLNQTLIPMTRVLISFNKYTDAVLESKTHSIISSMTGNANFPTPVPALAALTAAAAAFSAALIKASTGNRVDIADKNARRAELIALLRSLATYVNLTANGDRSMLISSGLELSKELEPLIITKPENLQVVNGISPGELVVSINAVKGAYAYLHQYTTDENMAPNSWVNNPSTSSKIVLSNLQSGTKYICRVGALGANDQLLYSDPVARIAA